MSSRMPTTTACSRISDPEKIQHGMRPEPKMLEAWEHYLRDLCGKMTEDERQGLKQDILERARAVATASGGFLGIGKISDAEKAMLERLEATFAS